MAIGYLSVLFNVDWHNRYGHGMVLNAFLITGVLGGYTTFSTFSYDTATLLEDGAYLRATVYVLSSVLLSLVGTFIGVSAARWVLRSVRS